MPREIPAMAKPKKKLTAAQRAEKKRRKEEFMVEYDLPTTRLHVLKAPGFPRASLDGLGKGFLESELGEVPKDLRPLTVSADERPGPAVRELLRDLGTDQVVAAPVRVDGYPLLEQSPGAMGSPDLAGGWPAAAGF
jgi:hypothetical protein